MIFMKKILKRQFCDGSCEQVLFPHRTYQVKLPHQNKKKKLQVKRQITVKSTPKRTQKNSRWINSPFDLPFFNYEGPMTKVTGTQTENTLFELRQPHNQLWRYLSALEKTNLLRHDQVLPTWAHIFIATNLKTNILQLYTICIYQKREKSTIHDCEVNRNC